MELVREFEVGRLYHHKDTLVPHSVYVQTAVTTIRNEILRLLDYVIRSLGCFPDGKFSKKYTYPVNAGVSPGSVLGPTLFLLYIINDLPDDVICDIAIYADDATFYSKCDQVSDLWQQLELASELESDL